MEMDGNPLDVCSIATYVAFQCCQVPKINLFAGESGNAEDFEISGDLSDATFMNIARIPILVTVLKVLYTILNKSC